MKSEKELKKKVDVVLTIVQKQLISYYPNSLALNNSSRYIGEDPIRGVRKSKEFLLLNQSIKRIQQYHRQSTFRKNAFRYLSVFFYFLDLSWILYRLPLIGKKQKYIPMSIFKEFIALIIINNSSVIKMGRPIFETTNFGIRQKSANFSDSSRMDNIGHPQVCVTDKRRCKLCMKCLIEFYL